MSAERQGNIAREMLAAVSSQLGSVEIAFSVVTLLELAHGAARAVVPERKARRQQFIEELLAALPIHPVNAAIALRAGQIDGENQARGVRLPLADLMIAVTALELGMVWRHAMFAVPHGPQPFRDSDLIFTLLPPSIPPASFRSSERS